MHLKRQRLQRNFSVLVGKQPADSSQVIRNFRVKDSDLISDYNGHKTLYDAFQDAVEKNKDRNCLGYRPLIKDHTEVKEVKGKKKNWVFPELGPYKWQTYATVSKRVDALGTALIASGLKEKQHLAIYMDTRAEWTLAAQAAFTQNIIVMTAYANLGEEALVHSLTQAECTHVLTSGDLLDTLSELLPKLPNLSYIVYCDAQKVDKETLDGFEQRGVKTIPFEEFEALGRKKVIPHNPPKPDDIAILMYTSGTTGMPKGVLCTHANCMAAIGAVLSMYELQPGDVHLSYLPLAHILAFVVEMGCIAAGVSVACGTPRTLSDSSVRNCKGDIREARPSFFVGVPTVLNKMRSAIKDEIKKQSSFKQFIFHTAYSRRKTTLDMGADTAFWNYFIFNKLKQTLGGNVRFIVSGGAPLSKDCGEFLRVCFGVPVVQGYAVTETTSGGTLGELNDLDSITNVGPPIPCAEIKLVDCPKMEYTHKDKEGPRGEIWIRGPMVSKGYFKMPDKTKEDFVDGWFKTGDIGRLNKNGTLSIVDRMKNLVKPPHGEYIALERLESAYKESPEVGNIMVHASSEHNELVALVQPNKKELESWASSNGIDKSWKELCKDKKAREHILEALEKTWKQANLKKIEHIEAVKLIPDEWTAENGYLTAAMKVQRQKVEKEHEKEIEKLYKKMDSESSKSSKQPA